VSDDNPGEAAAHAEHEAEWEALDEWFRNEAITAVAFRGDPLEHVAFAHDRHVEWADMVRRLRTRANNASDTLDTLREILGCDAEHGVVDQARDLVAECDSLRQMQRSGGSEADALRFDVETLRQRVEAAEASRHSLAQEIVGALRSRGAFVPPSWETQSSDLIGAVGAAIDAARAGGSDGK
jgi:hypothetical protein